MREELYTAITVFSDAYLKCQVNIVKENSVIFTDFNFKTDIISIHNDYIQFEFYDEYINYAFYDKPHKHVAGRFGTHLDSSLLIENVSLFDGETTAVFMDCLIMFSKCPIDIESYNKRIGLELVGGRIPDLELIKNQLRINNRVNEFTEMLDYCNSNIRLTKLTKQLMNNTIVYGEGFVSKKAPKKQGVVYFEENLTLLSAERYLNTGKKIAALNFANPVEPGGGVWRGANAQEEYLCRSSNLYKSLTSKNSEKYYADNNKIRSGNQFNSMFLGTDEVIYSPRVTVLKTVGGYLAQCIIGYKEIYADESFEIDILTCAAPFFSGSGYILPNGDLKYLLMRRIKNIFEVAIENGVDVLVLGAFGCGAFHNPPEVVASAFRECLLDLRYVKSFDEIVFAVKRESIPSTNIEVFERLFSNFPACNEDGHEKQIKKQLRGNSRR